MVVGHGVCSIVFLFVSACASFVVCGSMRRWSVVLARSVFSHCWFVGFFVPVSVLDSAHARKGESIQGVFFLF